MLERMPTAESETDAARRQLERVLASAGFSRNERLARFLRFVVERHLEGRDNELKESVIAVEIFGRKPGHDPRHDSIVRTEAGRLRARLGEYYLTEGKGDRLLIELPKGGYTPNFRDAHAAPPEWLHASHRKQWPASVWLIVAVCGVAASIALVNWLQFQYRRAIIPIAVLPLTNWSQNPADEYFVDGLTGEIIRNLSIIDGLEVRSQTSSFAFKDKPRNVRDAGKQLAADYILEGSVLRVGRQLRINAQLVRVRDDVPVWSDRYDRDLADIFTIQDEISRNIVNSLRLKLGRGRRRYESSAEAYAVYLRARALTIRHGLSGLNQSVGPFEEAIAKDPSFAPAYAGLATAHAARSGEFGFNRDDDLLKMRAAAEKALQLDPLLAEAHDALGKVYARDGRWEEAEKSFRRGIELEPGRSETYNHFAMNVLLPLGRTEEALRQLHIGERNDPLSAAVHDRLAYVLISAGRFDEAVGHCRKLPADYPTTSQCIGRARLGQGRLAEAIEVLANDFNRGVPAGSQVRGFLGYAYGVAGRRQDAENVAAATSWINPFNKALIFAGLRDKERTLEALDRAAAAGPFRMGRALTFPEFALLRGDPRLKVVRKKAGLPE